MNSYKNRVFDKMLAEELSVVDAILIEGAKWCGKTTTAEKAAKSAFYMDALGKKEENRILARTAPERIISGDTPRLIDEWQLAPSLWDAVRYQVDHMSGRGKYILTGSSVPADMDDVHHSGAGRFAWLRMRPMSLWESGDSSGAVSLGELFSGADPSGKVPNVIPLDKMAYLACRGGWPGISSLYSEAALDLPFSYLDAVVKSDISRIDGVERNEFTARRILRSYARLQGTQSTAAAIRSDLANNEPKTFSEATVNSYINALKKLFAIEDMPAWSPNLRSKTPIRTSDTRYFTDPSIAAAALGVGPEDLMNDLRTFGFIFEAMAVRDLRVYVGSMRGEVLHYKDANGLECDAVVHLRNGRYGLVEIKLGGMELIEKGAATLRKLASRIDATNMKAPSFLMVLTATGDVAYRREDGVLVSPLSALKP